MEPDRNYLMGRLGIILITRQQTNDFCKIASNCCLLIHTLLTQDKSAIDSGTGLPLTLVKEIAKVQFDPTGQMTDTTDF